MILTEDNYYSQEADMEYMSVSQFKAFNGTYGRRACEFQALKSLKGEWTSEKTAPLLIGSYVDSYFEGPESFEHFKNENPQIFKKDGSLYSTYKIAETVIKRIERDEYFMKYMSGEKQTIMTGELFGAKWKIKMDSYIPGIAIVDLKVMRSLTQKNYVADLGYLDFVRYWGYDIQGAVYQEIVRQNTGRKLPFYIAAASKEEEPDIQIIQVTQNYLNEALKVVETNMNRVLAVKNGEEEPDKCEHCDCCKHFRKLSRPISILDLIDDI